MDSRFPPLRSQRQIDALPRAVALPLASSLPWAEWVMAGLILAMLICT